MGELRIVSADKCWVIETSRLDKHHFKLKWIKEVLKAIGLVKVSEDLNIVIHNVVVFDTVLLFGLSALSIFINHGL